MDNIKVLYSEEEILKREEEIANTLYEKYGDREVVFLCTLKGAVVFFSDLVKKYKGDARFSFIRVSSYEGENSTGEITLKIPVKKEDIENKDVVIVEDIVDTGYTLKYLREHILSLGAKSVSECTLLNKKGRRVVDITPTYVGFEIPDLFVLGYGLDYDQKYRNLPYIGYIEK